MSIAATRAGVMLGTAAYMSPEQVRGKAVDRRSDVWAFGCVLYELLTGRRAFGGETVSDIIAAILGRDPDWTALPRELPPGVQRLLQRCFQKDARLRKHDIADVRLDIEEALASPPDAAVTAQPPRPFAPLVAWILAATGILAALVLAWIHFREKPPEPAMSQFLVLPPDKAAYIEYPAISPDGRRLAFAATVEGKTQLWIRPLDSLAAQPLLGTEEATLPFWSPDSRFVGFFAHGKLKKVDSSGGPPRTLCDALDPPRGGTWGLSDVIVFAAGSRQSIRPVSGTGGVSTSATELT